MDSVIDKISMELLVVDGVVGNRWYSVFAVINRCFTVSKFYSSALSVWFALLFALILAACDVVPSADDAPNTNEDRRQF